MTTETAARRRGGKGKWVAIAVAVGLLAAGGAYLRVRGPSGATTALGGSIEARPMPELPADAGRWVNGEPVSVAGARGKVVLIEGWHPA